MSRQRHAHCACIGEPCSASWQNRQGLCKFVINSSCNCLTLFVTLGTGFAARLAHDSREVFGEIRNLTDKEYISLFSVKYVAAADAAILTPGEPRSAYVGVKLRF